MAVARPLGFEIDFVTNPISESAASFFVIILKLIFTFVFEIKVHEKKFLDRQRKQYLTPTAWELMVNPLHKFKITTVL